MADDIEELNAPGVVFIGRSGKVPPARWGELLVDDESVVLPVPAAEIIRELRERGEE